MYIQIRIIQIHASIQQRRFYTPTRVLPWSQHVKWSRSSCQVQISRPSAGLDGGSGIRLGGILIRVPCITLVKRPFAGLKEHRSNAHSSPLHQSCKTLRQIYVYIYIIILSFISRLNIDEHQNPSRKNLNQPLWQHVGTALRHPRIATYHSRALLLNCHSHDIESVQRRRPSKRPCPGRCT